MKKILLLILISLLSCKTDKNKVPAEFEKTSKYQIDFLKREINLPDNYKKTTFENIIACIENKPQENELLKSAYQKNLILDNLNSEFEVFADKENCLNTIMFMSGEYIKLDKTLLYSYVEVLENQILNQTAELDIQNKIIEKEFLNYGETKAIKVKYQQTNKNVNKFMTQYIVTSGIKTFSIAIANHSNIDYEFILENFRL